MGERQRQRILVVEDEPILAITLQDMLEELGYAVVGPAFRIAAAVQLAEEAAIDAAVLDVNVGDGDSYGVAARLRERGIPYLFATGYGLRGIEEAYRSAPVLQKPFRARDLGLALEALVAPA